jgi:hypothetical protein
MAKITELSDGGSLQSTDFLIAVRSGGNVKVQADGNLSLGTVTADGLTVSGTTNTPTVFETSVAASYIQFKDSGTTVDNNNRIGSNGDTLTLWSGGTKAVTIDASQRLGIGTTDIDAQLHVYGQNQSTANLTDAGVSGATIRLSDNQTAAGSGGAVVFANNQGDVANSAGFAAIKGLLGNGSGNTLGDMAFSTRGATTDTALTERMRVTYNGNLLVGVTTNATTTSAEGLVYNNGGSLLVTRDQAPQLYLTRTSTNGTMVIFRRDAAEVGEIISVGGTDIAIGSGDTGLRFYNTEKRIQPFDIDSGLNSDALISLGASNKRFTDLYLSGGIYVGGAVAANYLDDYEEGTFTVTISCDSGTISLEAGANLLSYTKIGRLVHIQGGLNVLSVSSPSGQFRITSLPFDMDTSIGEDADLSAGSAALYNMASDVSGLINAEVSVVGVDTTILIRDGGGTAAGVAGIANKFDADSIVRLSLTYHTTS